MVWHFGRAVRASGGSDTRRRQSPRLECGSRVLVVDFDVVVVDVVEAAVWCLLQKK